MKEYNSFSFEELRHQALIKQDQVTVLRYLFDNSLYFIVFGIKVFISTPELSFHGELWVWGGNRSGT